MRGSTRTERRTYPCSRTRSSAVLCVRKNLDPAGERNAVLEPPRRRLGTASFTSDYTLLRSRNCDIVGCALSLRTLKSASLHQGDKAVNGIRMSIDSPDRARTTARTRGTKRAMLIVVVVAVLLGVGGYWLAHSSAENPPARGRRTRRARAVRGGPGGGAQCRCRSAWRRSPTATSTSRSMRSAR